MRASFDSSLEQLAAGRFPFGVARGQNRATKRVKIELKLKKVREFNSLRWNSY